VVEETLESPFFLDEQDTRSRKATKIIGKALNLYITPLVLWLLRIPKYNKFY
jgi:hypothetical protein